MTLMNSKVSIHSVKEGKKIIRQLQLKKNKKPKKLSDFLGALPNTFGDPLAYQKKVRSEWD